ncbi:hypothetical protein SCORR_v1c06530 [Spiroplasma corruscae]|uniref:Uncharacterized protein n=1 Tax=Spiroplasma corruscae TaxID=216934 RepID=A0A222EPG7_9MOLU|nr:hypothetical protein [Spiroplasma corruscae]ASP28425.1 hypothetical protein SCORR_v1c06530 [Spiroplasma corruscae]
MHIIKNDYYYLAFNKIIANKIINNLKEKKLCVIDFEAFQLYKSKKALYSHININDIPYTVCLNVIEYNEQIKEFVSSNEVVYQFKDDWRNEKELLLKLEEMAIFIANHIKSYKIDTFLFMSKFLEVSVLNFFVDKFTSIKELNKYLLIDTYDLYDFFYDSKTFNVLSYKYKPSDIIKSFMEKFGDEYSNEQIGKDGMKHFDKITSGKSSNILNFDKVIDHSYNDLKKCVALINYLNLLANWPDDKILNKDFL